LSFLQFDVTNFLTKNPACICTIVTSEIGGVIHKVFQIRGTLPITIPNTSQQRSIGFRFLLPKGYPAQDPIAFLDEPENPEVVDVADYIDQGNLIKFKYLFEWQRETSVFTQ